MSEGRQATRDRPGITNSPPGDIGEGIMRGRHAVAQ